MLSALTTGMPTFFGFDREGPAENNQEKLKKGDNWRILIRFVLIET